MALGASTGDRNPTVDLRADADRHDALLQRRLDELVPLAMERADLDVWLVLGREHAEGTVLRSMLPATWLQARRLTALVLTRDRATGAVTRQAVSRYAVGTAFPSCWDPEAQPDQWARIAEVVGAGDPRRIGIDVSANLGHGDGLSATDHAALVAALPERLRERLVSAEPAAATWLGTRLPEEVESLREAARLTHGYLRRALSAEAIAPGVTTTHDLEWWLRQRVHDDGLASWFHPTVRLQQALPPGGSAEPGSGPGSFADHPDAQVVQPGDLVHIDFGIVWHGLCTDQQQNGYVLRPGESEPPPELVAALAGANRLQDLLLAELRPGRSGDEVLAATRAAAIAEGLRPQVYSHPLGIQGHGAGPAIGLWDAQDGVPGAGGLPVEPQTCWSIELSVHHDAPGWPDGVVQLSLEEDAYLGEAAEAGVEWLDGRQTALHLIGPGPG